MTESTHASLEREASEARARLMATLDVLDVRARRVVHDATESVRSTAIALAGAAGLCLTFALFERSVRRPVTRVRQTPKRSILSDALRAGAVAFVFVSVSTWSKSATQPRASGRALEPHARRIAAVLAAVSGNGPRARALRAGTTHALPASSVVTSSNPSPSDIHHD